MSDRDGDEALDAATLRVDAPPLGVSEDQPSFPTQVDLGLSSLEERPDERYERIALLGEGGMGEVRLTRDRRVGREVAMKVIRAGQGTGPARERFEREARVQGQLEHPAVVPVYDLGVTDDGEAFFTMKRVRGLTLGEIIEGLREGDPVFTSEYTQRRLLGAMADVCLCIAYAHARGVVHRDLKPGNIMLGNFGEVHVLDWGVAKVGGSSPPLDGVVLERAVRAPTSESTRAGDLLGTPGYMAPEQVHAAPDAVDERVDIYGLGAIFFEVLTLQPLHARGPLQAMLAETIKGVDARPSVRVKSLEIPPELETICVRATALSPGDRYPSARAMHQAIERFLAGDRDLEQRRALASRHAREAARLAKQLHEGASGELRARAMREAGAAIALDPNDVVARQTLVELLVTAPTEIPAEAREEYAASRAPMEAAERRRTVFVLLVWAAFMPLTILIGVHDARALAAASVAIVAALATSLFSLRRLRDERLRLVTHALGCVVVAVASLFLGPLVLVPGMAATLTHAFVQGSDGRYNRVGVVFGVLSILVPFVLEALHLLPTAYDFHDGVMSILPRAVALPRDGILGFLLLASLNLVAAPAIYIGRLRERAAKAEERLFLQAWSLRQLVPEGARREAEARGRT
jgi:serine/threonine-protein kinase